MKKSEITDEVLVHYIVHNKDEESFGILYDRYHLQVFNKCLTFTREYASAEDLTHDIFIKTYLKLTSFSGRSKFSTWFYSIIYHECINYIRAKAKEKKVLTEQYDESEPYLVKIFHSDSEEKLLSLKVNALQEVLTSLDADDKAILLMKYQDEMSIDDIQDILGLGKSAVKMRLLRAREKALVIYEQVTSTKVYG